LDYLPAYFVFPNLACIMNATCYRNNNIVHDHA
jgi:hypothetical protein